MTNREPFSASAEAPLPCFVNRELSWLSFNRRVLEEAEDGNNPLGERLNFAAIFQSNLDEFFMVRVGGLCQRLASPRRENKTGLTSRQQLNRVTDQVRRDLERKDRDYFALMEQLAHEGQRILSWEELSTEQQHYLERFFRREVAPLLAPQIVTPRQSFPFLAGKTIYAVAILEKPQGGQRLGIVPCTVPVLEPLVRLGNGDNVLTEELILHFLPRIFQRYQVIRCALVRLLRSADLNLDEALTSEGYRTAMEELLRTRQRLQPVRLDYRGDEAVAEQLSRLLKLPRAQCYPSASPLDLSVLLRLREALEPRAELFYPRYFPQPPEAVSLDCPVLDQIRERDVLLSYPYESMEPFLRLLREAGRAPSVRSIAITLYRMADNSQVVDALCQAALNGKDVLVLVELRARFDEENNIGWSRVLEQAGCRVIYGIRGIKIHSKLCLITAEEEGKPFYYTQIGTGNYNEKTARLYTDLSLMTANQDLGR
jgi:polyphosphate kinase